MLFSKTIPETDGKLWRPHASRGTAQKRAADVPVVAQPTKFELHLAVTCTRIYLSGVMSWWSLALCASDECAVRATLDGGG
jgi:hypothetical protein